QKAIENFDRRERSPKSKACTVLPFNAFMGRRAKNKQSDPQPFIENRGKENRTRGAQVGKRKADVNADAEDGARPAKRSKGAVGKAVGPMGKSRGVAKDGKGRVK